MSDMPVTVFSRDVYAAISIYIHICSGLPHMFVLSKCEFIGSGTIWQVFLRQDCM